MMNPVLMLARNNLDLTKKAIESVKAQDIPTEILLIDNDSSDGTLNWGQEQDIHVVSFRPQLGVSAGWNWGLKYFFNRHGAEHVLVPNNDVVLPPWMYRCLLSYDYPIVSGVAERSWDAFSKAQEPLQTTFAPNPDFSCFMIRKACWEAIGPFDEAMVHYAGDCDYHLRMHLKAMRAMKAQQLSYFHVGSATIHSDGAGIKLQADKDRAAFWRKWGFGAGDEAYNSMFSEENFGLGLPKGGMGIRMEIV